MDKQDKCQCGKGAEWHGLCQDCWEEYCSATWWASYGGLVKTPEYEKLIDQKAKQ